MAEKRMLFALVLFILILAPSAGRSEEETPLSPHWMEDAVARYRTIKPIEQGESSDHLYLFFSLGMPEGSIRMMIEDAEKTGAILVLRGFKEADLGKTRDEIGRLIGSNKVEVDINPVLYKNFQIKEVPAMVLTRVSCESCKDQPREDDFIKLSGDVRLKWGLETLERQFPKWHPLIEKYLTRSIKVSK
jgi:conjugal transfer pilus assembly protein TrbC